MPKERKYENYWKWILFVTVGTNVCIYNQHLICLLLRKLIRKQIHFVISMMDSLK